MTNTHKRKPISKKIRFEIFKRDSFTCQYCGKKAPDVLLEIEHIKPVSKGGTNSLLNLTTACAACNSGKSDRELSDNSVIEKQRKQLEKLQERRDQLEMLMNWHEGLADHVNYEVESFLSYFNKINGCSVLLSQTANQKVKGLIKKYGFQKVLEAVDVLPTKYQSLTVEEKFNKIGGILMYLMASQDEKNVMYIKGVCRNRFGNLDYKDVELIKDVLGSYEYEYVLKISKTSNSYYRWKYIMKDLQNTLIADNTETLNP